MTDTTTIQLVRDVRTHIADGHPWLWAESLARRTDILTGTTVDVVTPDGQFVASGLYDSRSPLAVRLWSHTVGERIDEALIRARVEAACARRQRDVPLVDTDCLRLVHGESDHMPGLIADRYADVAVVQADTPAVAHLLPAFAAACRSRASPTARPHTAPQRRQQGDGPAVVALIGELPRGPVRVRENGLVFDVDIVRGHKTGAYLDQRDNRRRIRALAKGKRVLNLFSYTGWFSVAAAAGGAVAVTSVDVAAGAIEAARHNLALNGFDPKSGAFPCVVEDVEKWLEANTTQWDIIIVDPPSMAASASGLDRATAAYRQLNRLAIARTAPGGLLFTASCSSHLDTRTFSRLVDDSARDRGAKVRIVGRYGAGPDHPTPRWFPEARYLTMLQVVVDDPGQSRQDRPPRRSNAPGADERRYGGSTAPTRGGRPGAPPKGRPSAPSRPGAPRRPCPPPSRPAATESRSPRSRSRRTPGPFGHRSAIPGTPAQPGRAGRPPAPPPEPREPPPPEPPGPREPPPPEPRGPPPGRCGRPASPPPSRRAGPWEGPLYGPLGLPCGGPWREPSGREGRSEPAGRSRSGRGARGGRRLVAGRDAGRRFVQRP